MEKQPTPLRETEDPEVLQATYVRKTHVRTTPPLLDACDHGYGQCSYLRLTDDISQVHCSFVMGKAQVTPLKPVTIPRLELMAGLLSIRISASLQEELEYNQITEVFYTDSQVILSYIKNEA